MAGWPFSRGYISCGHMTKQPDMWTREEIIFLVEATATLKGQKLRNIFCIREQNPKGMGVGGGEN